MWSILMVIFIFYFKKNFLKMMFFKFLLFFILLLFNFKPMFFSKVFVLDNISLMFVFLSIYMIYMISLLFWKKFYFNNILGLKKLYLLLTFISFFFMFDKIMLFYIFFELSVMPAFFLILGWGKNPERFNAIFYLFSYTFIGSFPLFFSLMKNFKILFSLNFFFLLKFQWKYLNSFFMFFLLFAFMMKLPLYFFHAWLPKAHVEAPTMGSMILAALLLKMGAYGIFRFSLYKSKNSNLKWNLILGWTMMKLFFLGFIMFRLKDLKIIMAFSSINHMLLVMLGWYFFSKKKLLFCLILKIGHGFMSSKLFLSMGKFYEKSHSRNIFLKKGKNHIKSLFCLMWFLLLMAKSSAPTSISLYSEMGMMSHILKFFSFSFFFMFFFVVMGGCYCMFLFTKIFHGNFLFFKNFISYEKVFKLISFLHLFMIFFMIFFVNFLI